VTKAEARRNIYRCLALLTDPAAGHENDFLYSDQKGNEYSEADTKRLTEALEHIVAGFYRKASTLR